jgi:hypothetical protein
MNCIYNAETVNTEALANRNDIFNRLLKIFIKSVGHGNRDLSLQYWSNSRP